MSVAQSSSAAHIFSRAASIKMCVPIEENRARQEQARARVLTKGRKEANLTKKRAAQRERREFAPHNRKHITIK